MCNCLYYEQRLHTFANSFQRDSVEAVLAPAQSVRFGNSSKDNGDGDGASTFGDYEYFHLSVPARSTGRFA